MHCAECSTPATEGDTETDGDVETDGDRAELDSNTGTGGINGERGICDEALMVTADLRVKESNNRTIVLGSSWVGKTDPDDPIPETAEQPQQAAVGQDG